VICSLHRSNLEEELEVFPDLEVFLKHLVRYLPSSRYTGGPQSEELENDQFISELAVTEEATEAVGILGPAWFRRHRTLS
jgi:hypothetical protein